MARNLSKLSFNSFTCCSLPPLAPATLTQSHKSATTYHCKPPYKSLDSLFEARLVVTSTFVALRCLKNRKMLALLLNDASKSQNVERSKV
jgi:hypothetical protein